MKPPALSRRAFIASSLAAAAAVAPASAVLAQDAPVRIGIGSDPVFSSFCLASHEKMFEADKLNVAVQFYTDGGEALNALIAQQVNLAFAFACRARLVRRYGERVSCEGVELWAFPDAAALAGARVRTLRALKYSNRKAEYIRDLARAVVAAAGRAELNRRDAGLQERHRVGGPVAPDAHRLAIGQPRRGLAEREHVLVARRDAGGAACAGRVKRGMATKNTKSHKKYQDEASGWSRPSLRDGPVGIITSSTSRSQRW